MMPVIQFAIIAFLITLTVFIFSFAVLIKYNLAPQIEWPNWIIFVFGKTNEEEREAAKQSNIPLKMTNDLLVWSLGGTLIPSLMEGQGYMIKGVRKAHGLYIKETGLIREGAVFVYGLGGEITSISDSVISNSGPSSSRTDIQILTAAA